MTDNSISLAPVPAQGEREEVIDNAKDDTYCLGVPNSFAFRSGGHWLEKFTKRGQQPRPERYFQKMTVENGSVTMDLDLNGLNDIKDLKKSSWLPRWAREKNYLQ